MKGVSNWNFDVAALKKQAEMEHLEPVPEASPGADPCGSRRCVLSVLPARGKARYNSLHLEEVNAELCLTSKCMPWCACCFECFDRLSDGQPTCAQWKAPIRTVYQRQCQATTPRPPAPSSPNQPPPARRTRSLRWIFHPAYDLAHHISRVTEQLPHHCDPGGV